MLLIGFLEASLRVYVYYYKGESQLPYPKETKEHQIVNKELGYTLKPGFKGDTIFINSHGFRGKEFLLEKPKNTYRIAAIGDSVTFGNRTCFYSQYLENRLNETKANKIYEVINAGVSGYESIHAQKVYKHNVKRINPDLVIIWIGWNDIARINIRESRKNISGKNFLGKMSDILNYSYIVKAITRVIYITLPRIAAKNGIDLYRDFEFSEQHLSKYKENVTSLLNDIKSDGKIPIIVTLNPIFSDTISNFAKETAHYPLWTTSPYKYHESIKLTNSIIKEISTKNFIQVIDMAGEFNKLENKEKYFYDTMHLDCEGLKQVAEIFYNKLF